MNSQNTQTSQELKTGWLDRLNIGQLVFGFIASIIATSITIGVVKGTFETRLTNVEDTNKEQVNKAVYDSDMKAIKDSMQRIENTLNEIRKEQLDQIKRERRR